MKVKKENFQGGVRPHKLETYDDLDEEDDEGFGPDTYGQVKNTDPKYRQLFSPRDIDKEIVWQIDDNKDKEIQH